MSMLKRTHVLLLLLPLLLSSTPRPSTAHELNNLCAMTPYDIKTDANDPSINITHLLRKIPEAYRSKIAPPPAGLADDFVFSHSRANDRKWIGPPNNPGTWIDTRQDKLARLYREIVPVRLRILYDDAFEEEFQGNEDELNMYVKNMILDLQLRYEERKMVTAVRFNFIVRKLEKLKHQWPPEASVEDMFKTTNELQGNSSNPDYDMTFVLFYSHINGQGGTPVNGAAAIGSFCNPKESERIVLINAHSPNMALTLAHEFAHSLNVFHDGQKFGQWNDTMVPTVFERHCSDKPACHIMNPFSGAGCTTWSTCTVTAIVYYVTDEEIFKCLFDPQRLGNAKPISQMFDFSVDSPARLPLPGQQISLDRQCQLGYDKSIVSVDARFGLKYGITTCEMLYCLIDGEVLELRPALIGSKCFFINQNRAEQEGYCMYGSCHPVQRSMIHSDQHRLTGRKVDIRLGRQSV